MSMVNCNNRAFDKTQQDYRIIKNVLREGTLTYALLPLPLKKSTFLLDQTMKTCGNVDAAFKSTCLEMGSFLVSYEEFFNRRRGNHLSHQPVAEILALR